MTTRTATAPPTSLDETPKAVTAESDLVVTSTGRRVLAVLRLATGFLFLWAFLDKTFGLGFSTPVERAWINGGGPSQGFLTGDGVVGPLKPAFAAIASPASDILFMLGMIGIGVAVMLGIGLRISAVAGTIMMLLMYLAEWPFAANAGSTNPLVDYHIIYALALITIAFLSAGDTWGVGRAWKRLSIVQKMPWLV
ncbi:DoxX family protein [Salinibacterium sp. NK8237]|uniref:DoxX family protein n=1 Tax=Salinibacterium sp. NK8237 TaxID=2792038 RepID=UPI0018CEA77E|nr:DoxX family protein [Salinibacterium sp. NK8237]MBH0128915.1 DoxX family protein [Salinibacterium sp. NK8237]